MIINDVKESWSYQNWYHYFDNLVDESVIIQIPEDVLAYLHADGIVLPKEATVNSQVNNISRQESVGSDWDETESDAEEIMQPAFPHFSKQLADALKKLGGSAFIKLNWSAPYDAAWIMPDKTLRCTTIQDIYLLLKSSERIDNDLSYEFKGVNSSKKHIIVLKCWQDIDPGTEFRCFVFKNIFVAISQRDLIRACPYITEAKYDIIEDITQFYNDKLKDKVHMPAYSFDVVWKKKNVVKIIDMGQLDHSTKLLLFGWNEFDALADTSDDSVKIPELRFLGENPGHQPVYHGVPLDFNPQFVNEQSSMLSTVNGYMEIVDNFLSHSS